MDYFGFNEIAAGDFNGDGNRQIAIKTFRHHTGNIEQGVPGIHIFSGNTPETQPMQLLPIRHDIFLPFNQTDEPYIGYLGRMLMSGVPDITGNGKDELLLIGSSGMPNAVLHYGGDVIEETPGIIYESPNQNVTMGAPGSYTDRQFNTALGDFNGDGKSNFLVVQRDDLNFRDTPVYMYEIGERATSNEPVANIPLNYQLHQNYPNPFNPSTVISFELPQHSDVKLEVFDVLGRRVSVLADGFRQAGSYDVRFDGHNLASGMYIYRIQAGSYVQTRTLTLIK